MGGLLLLLGPAAVYSVVTALLAVATVLVLSLRGGARGPVAREPISVASLLSGVRFVRSRPIVLGSISLDLFAVLFGGATALLPIYAADILRVGPTGLGILRAGPAVGAAACAAILSARAIDGRVGRWLLGGVAAFGVGTIVFALSRSFVLSLAALVVMGAVDMVSVYIRHLLVQLATPDAIRGRVSAVNSVFINASNELGEFESGLTASWCGAGDRGGRRRAGHDRGCDHLGHRLPGAAPRRPLPAAGARRSWGRRRAVRGAGVESAAMFIDPVAFQLGPIAVHWYGIIIAAAVLAGGVIGTVEARRRGEDPERGWNMLMLVIVTSVIAARAYHVIHEWSYYSQHLDLIPQVWRGGIGIPGAIAGGAFGIWLYTRRAHLNTARWLDIFAPALLLGQAIGRLGNYVNQELYGPPLQQCGTGHFLPCFQFGIPIDAAHRIDTPWDEPRPVPGRHDPLRADVRVRGDPQPHRHGRAALRRAPLRAPLYDGDVALMYIVWYGAVRSLLEGYRVNNWYIGPLPDRGLDRRRRRHFGRRLPHPAPRSVAGGARAPGWTDPT